MGLSTRVQQTPVLTGRCPGNLLGSLPGTSWKRASCDRLEAPLRELNSADAKLSCASLQAYDNAVRVLELHGLGAQDVQEVEGDRVFKRHKLQQLSAAAREFFASLCVPSWLFDLGQVASPGPARSTDPDDPSRQRVLEREKKSGTAQQAVPVVRGSGPA